MQPSHSRSRFVRSLITLLLGFVLSAVCGLTCLQAATFTVTNNNDAGAGSLRQAVLDANATVAADTIVFAANVTGTITLLTGEMLIDQSLTITGPGANVLAISGNNNSRVFYVERVASVTISGLTITQGNGNGDTPGFGGGHP